MRRFLRRVPVCFILALLTAVVLWPGQPASANDAQPQPDAAAQASSEVGDLPPPSGDFYINDTAQLLSEETKSDIMAKNQELYGKYGVQLVVYTVNSFPAATYADRVAYLRSLLEYWQVGGAQGNGMVLALSVGDDDYLAVSGNGLSAQLTSENLKSLLDAHMEADFSAKSYDAGVAKFFSACASQVDAFCAQNPGLFAPPAESSPGIETPASSTGVRLGQEESGSGVPVWIFFGCGAVVVVCIVLFFKASQARNRRSRRTVHGGRSRGLQSTVIRSETRPTVQIKYSGQRSVPYRGRGRSGGDRL